MKPINFKDIILFEDDNLFVVNKPPFLATLDERNNYEPSLIRLAKEYFPEAQICHRLDKETSGALIIAKNPETYRSVSMQFEHRKVEKIYHAVIEGTHQFKELDINLPILNEGKEKVKISRAQGKRAETQFTSIKFFRHFTLVECKPLTGRMHQIRIHLATQRAVIAGDESYGGKPPMLSLIKKKNYKLSEEEEEQPIIKRFALHAYQVSFVDPTGVAVCIHAPYPKDFAAFLKLLERYDS